MGIWKKIILKSISITFSTITIFPSIAGADAQKIQANNDFGVRIEVQLGHKGPINSAAISKDGRLLATVSKDGSAILWEASTGAQLRHFKGHRAAVRSAALSAAGGLLLTASDDGTARVWETATGKEIRQFAGAGGVTIASFSPDSRYILVVRSVEAWVEQARRTWDSALRKNKVDPSDSENEKDANVVDSTAQIFEIETGRELWQTKFQRYLDSSTPAKFSPDSRSVLIFALDGARLWKLFDKPKPLLFKGKDNRTISRMNYVGELELFTDGSFSPDGRRVLLNSKHAAHLWDIETVREIRRFGGQSNYFASSAVFSSDGRTVLTSGLDVTSLIANYRSGKADAVISLWDTEGGKLIRQFGWIISVKHASMLPGSKMNAMFSPDGVNILTYSKDGLRLWATATGLELRRLEGHKDLVTMADFTANGRNLVTTSRDRTARLWDTESGREVRRYAGQDGGNNNPVFTDGQGNSHDSIAIDMLDKVVGGTGLLQQFEPNGAITSAVFSADGRSILTSSTNGVASLWDVTRRGNVQRFAKDEEVMYSAKLSPDERKVLTAHQRGAYLWDRFTGRTIRTFAIQYGAVLSIAFSPDGSRILTAGWDNIVHVWESDTGKELRPLKGHDSWVTSVAISSDNKHVLTASWDRTARMWDSSTGKEVWRFEGHNDSLTSALFSPDGETILTASLDKTARLLKRKDGQQLVRFEGHSDAVTSAVFTSGVKSSSTPNLNTTTRQFDNEIAKSVRAAESYSETTSSQPTLNEIRILTASLDKTARLWDGSGKELRQFVDPGGGINNANVSPDNRFIITASVAGATHIWRMEDGLEIVRLINVKANTWIAINSAGQFDTNNLDEIAGVRMIVSDNPFKSLSPDIFMRDYYEWDLFSRVMSGETLPEVRPVTALNRVQPKVEIIQVDVEHAASGETLNTVAVTVQVAGSIENIESAESQRELSTGVYDLRLFRDGQLVGQFPRETASASKVTVSPGEGREQWRTEKRVTGFEEGSRKIVFTGIRLPQLSGVKEVEFTAYALNEDRVKSQTARVVHAVPIQLPLRPARAYVLTVGVNSFEDASWDLKFAANDARDGSLLKTRLEQLKNAQGAKSYEQVIWVPLISETTKGEQRGIYATKAQIETVLKTLAGQPTDASTLSGIPGTEKLRRVNPEDLVIIMISTHGVVDKRNRKFYFLPSDIGKQFTGANGPWDQAVSNDDLTEWMQGLDARDQVMIIDTCYSAATVRSEDFKPGPLGSRGLGQLAYDQRMRILAASQPDQVANEPLEIGNGLLTHSLLIDGLGDDRADYRPKDGNILISEWLNYAVERVPELDMQITKEGDQQQVQIRGDVIWKKRIETASRASLQRPQLFDFSRTGDTVLATTAPPLQ